MIPALPKSWASELSFNYEFSRGQIENIVRKQTIGQIFHSRELLLDVLNIYCEEELLDKKYLESVLDINKITNFTFMNHFVAIDFEAANGKRINVCSVEHYNRSLWGGCELLGTTLPNHQWHILSTTFKNKYL